MKTIIGRRAALKLGAGAAGVLAMPFYARNALAETPIKLGSLLDATGTIGLEGSRMTQTTQYAVDVLNKQGGLLGRPIKLINYDTQSSMQLYSQYAQQLVLKDRVDVVQGGITSASREAIRPILDRFKTLYFYNTQYEGGVCDHNVFCTGTTPSQTVSHVVNYALKNWGKKCYIIAADYNYGHITAAWVQKYLKDGSASTVATDYFPLDVTNFSSAISRIQQAQPDFVFSALVGANQAGFYRQWDAAGMKGKIPLGSSVFGLGDELVSMDHSTTDGIVTSFGYYNDLKNPQNTAFLAGMNAKFGNVNDLSELDSATYEGIMLWAEGVKKAGSVAQPKVIDALQSGISIEGPSGHVALSPELHATIRNAYLAKPVNGVWDIMETYPNQTPTDTGDKCNLVKNPRMATQFTPSL
ncbi:ABC transporter substrate-binding protein [Acidocella sp.]|uniref:ABC transporter substrate-binding protein n=1 Tax=Acidocella sp. TaxID=50710 RepID=UPI003D08A44E